MNEEIDGTPFKIVPLVGGILFTLALMFLAVSLSGALGVWSMREEDLLYAGTRFWFWASFAWVVCVSVGSFFASWTSFPSSRSGLVPAVVVWAGAYLIFGGMTWNLSESVIGRSFANPDRQLLAVVCAGDFLSLFMSLMAGMVANKIRSGRAVLEFRTHRPEIRESLKVS